MTELRKVQLVEIEILKEIYRICNKHNLRCFLWYGTLLGALRHDGFIPWDDDIDLAMPEEDYDQFIQFAKTEMGKDFFLHSIETDKNYFPDFIRIRRNNTIYIPDVYRNTNFIHNGLWIDVMPLHYARSDSSLTEKAKFWILRKVFRPLTAIKVLGVKKQSIFAKVCEKIARKMNIYTLQRMNDRVARSCKRENGKFYVCEGTSMNMHRYYYPVEYFGDGVMHTFEGLQCRIPNESDKLLRQVYGDYMQLPPEEERVGHLPTICDLSKVEVSER